MPDIDPQELKAAYEHVLPALRAIPERDVKKPRVDIAVAAGFVLAALPKIEKIRAELLALPLTDKTMLEELGIRARALMWVYSNQSATSAPSAAVDPALIVEATSAREKLLLTADFLEGMNVFDRSVIAQLREGIGFADLGRDLLTLGGIFAPLRALIEKEAPSALPYADKALGLGQRVLVASGAKAQPGEAAESTLLGDRVYTLFIAAYENTRQGIAYLRAPHGDAEKILPSIYTNGRINRGGDEPAPVPPAPAPAPPTPMSTAVNGSAGAPVAHDPDSPFVT